MAKQFPKTLYVKTEEADGESYFVADAAAATLVDMNETVQIAKYQLVETSYAEGVAQFSKPKRPR